ncbi:MAG TPA: GNAT family N-acetyltransferase [Actinomycetota bacterium]
MNLPPGYTSRPAFHDDLDAIVELVDAVDRADVGLWDPVRDELRWEWSAPRFRLERDTRVVLDGDGRLIAYADVHAHDPSVQIRAWTQVHPGHRSDDLGNGLLAWIEDHGRGLLPDGARDVPLRHGGSATGAWTSELLRARGFAHARTFRQMARPLVADEPAPAEVDGIRFRPSERGRDDRAIYDVDDGAFQGHFGYEPMAFDEWSAQWFSDPNYDPGLVFMAFDDETPVGLSLSLIEEGVGWVGVLGVLAPWRQRGVGRALLQRAFAELARRGVAETRLGVDADNEHRASHLYESAGMVLRREWHIYEKPISAG